MLRRHLLEILEISKLLKKCKKYAHMDINRPEITLVNGFCGGKIEFGFSQLEPKLVPKNFLLHFLFQKLISLVFRTAFFDFPGFS